ncbi:BLUF domain-containing protein [Hymenobacter taeanensis]|uniref:BLUF domain-containing protein n=1 Tax=Hymenobacter taeanensis TaxID=2735321 RepID=A0A6M6BJN1_9BACT|nr:MULTISPECIES: BLUF domain-containing protein [Hymenobacter]QJX48179.1 BLUF domain-containing protein [Hymenobacter taeanensis]UOQ82347.1 BLUF domain-containing protein [Hymenobacter sp. 5414T-23]
MASATLHHLVYQSIATTPLDDNALGAILLRSRSWNEAHNLTGILLYCDGEIMQVLEGEKNEVHYIFARIREDQRHFRVVKLSDGPIQKRNFSQWSMGFKAVAPEAFADLKGYTNPEGENYLSSYSENDNISLHSLLSTFVTEDEIRF